MSLDYDVVVAGAGVAGVAAALETARAGLRTALVEKTILVGGLATAGLINHYLPLCDGRGHQVTFGIAEELLHLSLKYGPGDVPATWREGKGERYRARFSPASFVLALDEALLDASVELWLDTLVCQPVLEGNRVVGIEVENKSGRGVLRAACIVEATGDADVAYRAGAKCAEADNWLSVWALQLSGMLYSCDHTQGAVAQPDQPPAPARLELVHLGASNSGAGAPPGVEKMLGTDAAQVTRFVLEGRRMLREHYQAQQAQGGDCSRYHLFPVTLPAMAQFRTTRRIVGRETLSEGGQGAYVPTSVGLVADWRRPARHSESPPPSMESPAGTIWEIPYGALIPQDVAGLVVAGRCISSEGDAWEVTRVIPAAALTGQVAGIAARLAVLHHTTPDQLSAQSVQQELRDKGVPFHIEDVMH